MQYTTLNNSNLIPLIGLGTYKNTFYNDILTSLKNSFNKGIFLIDTAEIYGNENFIGNAINELGIDRKKLFITSKVWNSEQGYDSTLRSFEKSLKNLQTDYLDLYLIHWPVSNRFSETWKALEKLYEQKSVKNIGVSNFHIHHLETLLKTAKIIPAVNQIELHPYMQQKVIVDYCNSKKIAVEAWSPLAKGKVTNDSLLTEIGSKYKKNAVQVTLRWHIQNGIIAIPKSSKSERIEQFADIFDFELNDDEMNQIAKIDKARRLGPDPDNFNF